MKIETLKQDMIALLPKIDSTEFDLEVFKESGVFVVRNAIPKDKLEQWQSHWKAYYESDIGKRRKPEYEYNKVEVKDIPEPLAAIHRESCFLDIVEQLFGPNIGLFNKRFVVKDSLSRGSVFLHQDTCYQFGGVAKASIFAALFDANPENGGLAFHLGTHKFGYLGDAGEIRDDLLPEDWPVVHPRLNAGDLAVMNSLTWHGSPPHSSGNDRVMTDFIYQDAEDFSTVEVVRGNAEIEPNFLNRSREDCLFKRSRVTRLKELQALEDAS